MSSNGEGVISGIQITLYRCFFGNLNYDVLDSKALSSQKGRCKIYEDKMIYSTAGNKQN
jgi:hypothetical protein